MVLEKKTVLFLQPNDVRYAVRKARPPTEYITIQNVHCMETHVPAVQTPVLVPVMPVLVGASWTSKEQKTPWTACKLKTDLPDGSEKITVQFLQPNDAIGML